MHDLAQVLQQICDQTIWSPWQSLEGCWRGNALPACAGIYRLRVAGQQELLYVGESTNLKQRAAMLKPVFDDRSMPYRSPHVAGPHLWALRQAATPAFELSFAALALDEPLRKGVEYLVIALHRQRFTRSPSANFGRMPAGWKASSSNTATLAARGLRFRGGPTAVADESHLPGVTPLASLEHAGSPQSLVWGGHCWSPWYPVSEADPGAVQGLYRLRRTNQELFFIGQGQIADRLKRCRTFEGACSWVSGTWWYHQQLELVCDLVAASLLFSHALPPAQFGLSTSQGKHRPGQEQTPDRAWWLRLADRWYKEQQHLRGLAYGMIAS